MRRGIGRSKKAGVVKGRGGTCVTSVGRCSVEESARDERRNRHYITNLQIYNSKITKIQK